MRLDAVDMPKLQSPFIRKEINGQYVVTPEIDPEYRWVFENSIALDKLDGTNVSVQIQNGRIKSVYNRLNCVDPWGGDSRIQRAIREAVERGYLQPAKLDDGSYYGECIGEGIQGNPYKLDTNLWIPFSTVREKYQLNYWQTLLQEFANKSDKEIYETISEFFKGLFSLYARTRGLKGEINENTVFPNDGCAEGLVFYSPDGKMAKLRRDMFDWYKGARH